MIKTNELSKRLANKLRAENDAESAKHEPSGRLSASQMGMPLQWQVLHFLKVPRKPFDDYTLGIFARGKDVENAVLSRLDVQERQKEVIYREAIGIVDFTASITLDKQLTMPFEVKSVKNSKFKRILAQNRPDESHLLQGCFYAMALKMTHFGIVYVAADDLRIDTFIFETEQYAGIVDERIREFQKQVAKKQVPVFIPREKWQADEKYQNYPEWATLSQDEINKKVAREGYQFIVNN